MTRRAFQIAAARYALGMADKDQLINVADEALTDGIYSYSLGELGTRRDPTWGECSDLFVGAMRELDVAVPDPAAAIMTLLEFHVVRLVEGVTPPEEALRELYSIEFGFKYDPPVTVAPSDLEPLQPFINRYCAIDSYVRYHRDTVEPGLPPPELTRLNDLVAEVVALADGWCQSRWAGATDEFWLTPDVLTLARGVAADKAFDRLPILADALQDAGCEDEFVLEHLRNDRPHVRCCFAVDLLLRSEPRGAHR